MGSTALRVLKNTTVLAAGNLVTKGMSAVLVVALARYLEDYGFGQYNFALAFAAVFIIFADLGLDALTVRDVARRPESAGRYLEGVGMLRLGLSLISLGAALTAGMLLGLDGYMLLVILVAGAAYMFDKLSGLFYALFRSMGRMELEAGTQMLWKSLQLGLGLGAIWLGLPLLDVMLLLLVASVAKTITGFTLLAGLGITPTAPGIPRNELARRTAPFAAYEVGNALYANIAVIMLFLLRAPEDTGWFSASLRMLMFLLLIPRAFDAAIYPVLARLHGQAAGGSGGGGSDGGRARAGGELKTVFGKSVKFSLMAAVPVAVLLASAPDAFAGIFGSDFRNSGQPLLIMALALPLLTLNMLMKSALWSTDAQGRMAANIWAAAGVLAAASFLLVTRQGYLGAAMAMVIGEVCLFVLNLLAVRGRGLPAGRYLWKIAGAGAGMALAWQAFALVLDGRVGVPYLGFMAVLAYVLLLLASGVVTGSDRKLLRGIAAGLSAGFRQGTRKRP